MLDESDVTAVLSAALTSGGDWAEVYAERRDSTAIRIEDRRVEELTSTRSQGVGVRVVKGTHRRPTPTPTCSPATRCSAPPRPQRRASRVPSR